ncbi:MULTISPECIES: hypothetical protein [unclassified Stenotrophomonas]|uniref:hypothetical protein n=1 Tax=unclassified Stenotrophomonas TaxID=196198 RepID=UPI0034656695
MPQKLIDQTTIQPDGSPGDDAFTAFAICNDNFEDAEARLVLLESGGGEIGGRLDNEITERTAADAALGARIDAEHSLITQETADRITAVQAEATARANVDTALGLRILGKNGFINGDFEWWQRGTTFNGAGYTADRWYFNAGGVASPNVVRNPIALGQFPNIKAPAFARVSYGAISDAAAHFVVYEQLIEGANTYAGQQVTVSFKVFNSGAAGRQIALEVRQNFGSGGSATVSGIGAKKFALAAGINSITHTVNVPSVAGKSFGANNSLGFALWASAGTNWNARSDSLGAQSGDVHFTEVQIEPGAIATEFERVPKALSLMQCQRYCYPYEVMSGGGFTTAIGLGNSQILAFLELPVTMRAMPSATSVLGAPTLTGAGSSGAGAASGQNYIPVSSQRVALVATFSGFTVTPNAVGYLGAGPQGYKVIMDAEL